MTGIELALAGRYEDSLQAFLEERPVPWNNVGNTLRNMGRLQESRACFERIIQIDPENREAHYNLSLTLLIGGEMVAGFREYEYRERPQINLATWRGEDLSGKRVLLWSEQGAGDAIQFVRYARTVSERGGRPVVAVPDALKRLFSWLPVEISGQVVQADLQCPLLSLPHAVGSILPPAVFSVPAEVDRRWARIVGDEPGFKVGLVWAGNPEHDNDRNRSIGLAPLAPLLAAPGVRIVSLQVGQPAPPAPVVDLSSYLVDFAATAGAIRQMDLVVTVDTSVAHLAGSLGVPTWILLPYAPDWRWMLEREDSPWYPTVRLFRQPEPGDWNSVVENVLAALSSV